MPPSKRLRCDDPEWTRRKTAIEMMYVVDRLSQKKIRDKLKEDRFFVTKSELEAQLHFWNIRKNASADVWRYTDHRLLKREQQGKTSVVYHNGRKVLRDTLKKERSRYQPDTLTKYMTAVSPKTPEGMELWIRTPTPAPMQLAWAHTLPWIQFQNEVLPSILDLTHRVIDNDPQHRESQTRLDFSPLHRQFNGDPFRNAFDFAINVASMMPEKADNAIANSAQIIAKGATDQAFNEHIQLILYCLSNNMYEIDYEDDSSWLTVVTLIERSGLTKQPLKLAQQTDFTITSIAENLFKRCIEFRSVESSRSELHMSNSKTISWLLESGQNPDVEVNVNGETSSPLRCATSRYDYELAMELLDAGADPNKSFDQKTPLLGLLRDDQGVYLKMTPKQRDAFKNLVLRLLEAGTSLHEGPSDDGPSALMWAVRLDLEIADILIQHGAKIEHQRHAYYTNMGGWQFVRIQSVMGFAMYRSDEEQAMRKVQHLIGQVRRSHSSIPVADLLPADVVCRAAYFGFKRIVEYCCGCRNTTNTRPHVLFSALCAASLSGRREACELLLQYGAPIGGPKGLEAIPSPLHFAALMGHSNVVELLCDYGADVNVEFKPSGGFDHARNYMWNRVITSLEVERRLGGYYSQKILGMHSLRINALGAAIVGADERAPQLFEILIKYGAKVPIWAAYYGAIIPQHPGTVYFAVKQGANLNWRGPDGKTPLQRALQPFTMTIRVKNRLKFDKNDCLAVINSLVDAGAETAGSEAELIVVLGCWSHTDEVSSRAFGNNSQWKAHHLSKLAAIFLSRSIPRIERVLANCLGAYDPGALCAAVMLAISSGSTEPLQQLIINRPEIIHGAEQEGVALGLAAWHSRVDILDILLSKIQSSTPALIPAYSHAWETPMTIPSKEELQKDISESFEEEIPFWHQQSKDEREFLRGSPLLFSIWSQECLDKLLENDFRPDRLTLSVAVCNGEIELLEKLVHRKLVDDSDLDRPGPLYWSVVRRLEGMTRVLLKAGLSPNEPNELVHRGRSPLQSAVEDGNLRIIDLLLESGADFNASAAKKEGATALQLAAIQGRLGIARRMIDLGANVNALGAEVYGRTALEGAAERGRLDMVQLLLDCGANVVGDGCLQYFRAIRFAEEEAHMVVANVLKNHREWTNFDFETWERVVGLEKDELEGLEELIPSSAGTPSSSCGDEDGPEDIARVISHFDHEVKSSWEEPFREGINDGNEAALVERTPGRLENSSVAMFTGAGYDNIVVENHLASLMYGQPAWNQQTGNAEDGIQVSWEGSPIIGTIHDLHAFQGSEILHIDNRLGCDQQPEWANQELQALWESKLIGGLDNDVTMEEQVFSAMGVEMTWNQQLGIIDWNDPRNWLGTEIGSGICHEVLEGDVDWVDIQNPDA
ncbi:hypothetical protein GCG54_00006876 [Colletotrichum gloeosporioides]|uniref:Clr5 domain-containing protein n=1 Tax=Colletotrichum gloeosporioides TaxID=474922 RepID=A0A8H4CR21_COLGL|nr:uncharacterized protein GCG54_00006876 [Colletotrichum gloeosporioides]KAF3808257.1 hypothetical protein GCG54_00006876 [Colletotrichum gloeosporioides]